MNTNSWKFIEKTKLDSRLILKTRSSNEQKTLYCMSSHFILIIHPKFLSYFPKSFDYEMDQIKEQVLGCAFVVFYIGTI